jgi:carbon-monoxide dehydrogenase small subunit
MDIAFTLNQRPVRIDVPPTTLLVHAIRQHLRLTGTHVGCDTAQCGACTVHVEGRAVKSCNMLAAQAEGLQVTTIEGIAPVGGMHPMQTAFKACHGLQCGFCTPGMVMSAIDLCTRHPEASAREVRELLDGNICRCTGYDTIVAAVRAGGAAMREANTGEG